MPSRFDITTDERKMIDLRKTGLHPLELRKDIRAPLTPTSGQAPAPAAGIVTPFLVTPGTGTTVHIKGGSYFGATIADGTATITGVGTEYIVLKPVHALTVSHLFVYTSSFTSSTFDVAASGSESKVDSLTGSDYVFPLAKLVDGVKQLQFITRIITGRIYDDQTGTGTGTLVYFG